LKKEKFYTFCHWLSLVRKARQSFFPVEWLSDPMWDIMIALILAKLEGRTTPVSNIGLEANVPVSTALRKLKEIEMRGLINRWPDPSDKRREYVEISEYGLKQFTDYVEFVWDKCSEFGFMGS
jgi:DNA-binding MarR family transcriptional regulator